LIVVPSCRIEFRQDKLSTGIGFGWHGKFQCCLNLRDVKQVSREEKRISAGFLPIFDALLAQEPYS
jgi:hypothetical protein